MVSASSHGLPDHRQTRLLRRDDPPQAKQVEKDVTVRLLCTTSFGNPIRYNTFNVRSWKPALAAAGVIAARDKEAKGSGYESSRENGFHVLRHTFATAQLRFGVSIVAVSRWLGHKDPAFTLRKYVHFLPADDERGRQAMQSWWGKTP
ncbi:tyrosine-type recombinase/integrase [Streptomyces sp. NPDC057654]|uniref:tyrosine-type recombinase/integrase n=1 Tax=Streptomyces sp. NPDC057654 TaxID=3346196 RepID=UPI00368815F8